MTDEIKTGGPAFPFVPGEGSALYESEGMTLHDYFYAQAMAAIISNPRLIDSLELQNIGWVVAKAKDAANLMIKARG
ncbi:hypothetical protein [Yersinia bercovieri]|uniref:hypothetical protein n=1 Tax=Yersinia bercovieri TaxID=634 RepID=UPI0005DD4E25|nr:hypothetical protein [Yersinia bercovieri]CNI60179.1 Uncharacterised protein [Yersinia bercovieri]